MEQELVSIEIMRDILYNQFLENGHMRTRKSERVLELNNQSVLDNFEIYIGMLRIHLEEANEFAMKEIMMNYCISNGEFEQTANNFKLLNTEETLESFSNLIKAMEYFLEKGKKEYKNASN
jgi:hypothetical protein